ncbi:hypothetical protein A0J61_02444 [Choanephora cucurbitarum]|uniref:DUF2470 domain-containing protein n=1 Tax=Choanephora cucurbitarum TaxID=101091 RepID=A0A1C7NKK3_9FUNG|nr:hypothetical protein A0J61_02444 [Choanephora cucurbitarum]
MSEFPDPIAVFSAPISAYMSGHANVNLAYVKYFAKKTDATKAEFRNLNSQGFTVAYTLPDGSEHEAFIQFNEPVKQREDIRPILENMAKEAEEALGMPSSMDNPPNIKAITKAAEIEEAQQAEVNKLQKERRSSLDLRKYMGQNGLSSISKDVFYEADTHWKVAIVSGLMLNGLLGYGSEEFLHTYVPSFLLTVRDYLTPQLTRSILHWAVVTHLGESVVALTICLKRGWYSPLNILRWTGSTFLYGFASMSKLMKHGKQVKLASKEE